MTKQSIPEESYLKGMGWGGAGMVWQDLLSAVGEKTKLSACPKTEHRSQLKMFP